MVRVSTLYLVLYHAPENNDALTIIYHLQCFSAADISTSAVLSFADLVHISDRCLYLVVRGLSIRILLIEIALFDDGCHSGGFPASECSNQKVAEFRRAQPKVDDCVAACCLGLFEEFLVGFSGIRNDGDEQYSDITTPG